MNRTSLWGITFDTDIELPGRAPDETTDVTIRFGSVPATIPEVRSEGAAYQAGPGLFRLAIPGVAAFLISGGSEIVVEADESAHPDTIRLLLLGTPMGALLHQRERIPLHAAAVEVDGRAVLISGFSAHGKSTVAATLHKRGHTVISDDICAVHADDKGAVVVEPGTTELQLWHDAVKRLGEEPGDYVRARPELQKYRVPVNTVSEPLPASAMYVLGNHNQDGFDIAEIESFGKVRTILTQTRGSGYLEGMGAGPFHFRTSMAMATQVTMKRLVWPRGIADVGAVCDALLEDLNS
ncbi:MAG: hypothetical protein GY925_08290 [Actinomycetia bacterium]|nr:hypothetical protein [Actinomycetes bacterium]